ncbi:MAG: formylglycine-generating enzyme family protein [Prevotellaceae bacterium]|jgi:formylglycine-generating enzyme required for sulfatase activity|nr:formylglycine-generating enzyme family protein [Prevotellaceae bacterium]
MKQNYKIYLCALLLVGAVNTMTIGALGADKPTLAVFVVGGNNSHVAPLTTALRTNLTSGGRYTLTSVSTNDKLTELQAAYTAGSGSSINRNALAEWGRDNSISTICLVVDDVKGNDHLFSAQLIDTKDSKLEGRGSYIRTDVAAVDVARIALALSRQLDGPKHRRSAPAPARRYPAELDIEMVFVEGGTFTMGYLPERDGDDSHWLNSERPAHSVTVSSFYIGKYEVTQAQWKSVMGTPDITNDDQTAVLAIRNDVNAFLTNLNRITGKSYRLPTEAEWEYAARGGKMSQGYMYSGSNDCDEASINGPQRVGMKKPNELGIYDMSGNVWELCSNYFYYYSSTPQTDPQGPSSSGMNPVRRGGGGSDVCIHRRISGRNVNLPPETHWGNTGFRVALPAQ